jgi:DNA-binding NtrC family response regulator
MGEMDGRPAAPAPRGPRYCLRGVVRGRERRFFLLPGINQVGSLASGEIVLAEKGISRRHAAIDVQGDSVTLRDLGSKNGTLHNGLAAVEAHLVAGDRVQLGGRGGVQLELERLSGADGELAIHFRSPAAIEGVEAVETSLLAGRVGELLAAVDRLIEQLQAAAEDGWTATAAALRTLVAACGATGAIAGSWDGAGEPVALAACGDAAAASAAPEQMMAALAAIRECASHEAPGGLAGGAIWRGFGLPAGGAAACGRLSSSGGGLLYLAIFGAIEHDGGVAEGLARIFLQLLDRRQAATGAEAQEPAASPARPGQAAGGRDLVLPQGYVRSQSPAMEQVYAAVAELAGSDLGLLIEGETGVGKECLVRMLHASSPRAGEPFVAINCAAIPAELLEAELFGIRKGVATGVEERRGRFQQAARGTLFLDEVADLPPGLQGKLLRVLQERMVEPVGGTPRPLQARIVAATNRRLDEEVAQGRFRADLYYRIAGYVLQVPPLRGRRQDIPLLLESLAWREAKAAGKRLHGVTVSALGALVAYSWPGNVRELENEVRGMVRRCPPGGAIDSSMLSAAVLRGGSPRAAAGPGDPHGELDSDLDLGLQGAVDRLERRLILRAIERTAGNRSQAARLLGISRNGLAEKMGRLRITLQLQAGGQDG